jgi:hypothetical protein
VGDVPESRRFSREYSRLFGDPPQAGPRSYSNIAAISREL